MTTIAYRDGVMASDSRGYGGDRAPVGSKTKIHRLPDGTLMGCSSNAPGQPEAVFAWYAGGADPREAPAFGDAKFRLLVVRPDGQSFLGENSFYLSGPLDARFFAVGSGQEYALGAMEAGASAVRAVEVAIKLDVWSDGEVRVLRHVEAA